MDCKGFGRENLGEKQKTLLIFWMGQAGGLLLPPTCPLMGSLPRFTLSHKNTGLLHPVLIPFGWNYMERFRLRRITTQAADSISAEAYSTMWVGSPVLGTSLAERLAFKVTVTASEASSVSVS